MKLLNLILLILTQLGTKTLQQCIQFYYLWKKVCPEDYKQFQSLRRKCRENNSMNPKSDIPVSTLCIQMFDNIV